MNNYFSQETISYTSYINLQIKDFFIKKNTGVVFGQNIVSGSRISGLGNGLDKLDNIRSINSTNSENALMGLGLGLALGGVPAIFLMKQHDFAILGLDQLTNTVNLISNQGFKESFIVIMVVVDSGFEGPQASLNNIDDFVSLTRSHVYFLNSKENIENAFMCAESPGLHMMVLSQKTMKEPLFNASISTKKIGNLIKYEGNNGASICENLIIFTGVNLTFLNSVIELAFNYNLNFDVMVASDISPMYKSDYSEHFIKYKKIALIHDSKSIFTSSHYLANKISDSGRSIKVFTRQASDIWSTTNSDIPEYKAEEIIEFLDI
jgi:hypothetical protein